MKFLPPPKGNAPAGNPDGTDATASFRFSSGETIADCPRDGELPAPTLLAPDLENDGDELNPPLPVIGLLPPALPSKSGFPAFPKLIVGFPDEGSLGCDVVAVPVVVGGAEICHDCCAASGGDAGAV